jgi:hypothetical protein
MKYLEDKREAESKLHGIKDENYEDYKRTIHEN